MTNKKIKISHKEIVSAIENEIKKDDSLWLISRIYDYEPRLPIDLFCQKIVGFDEEAKKDKVDYHVFLAVSVYEVTEHLQNLLNFCRFFLTFYLSPSPRDLKLTLVVLSDADIADDDFYKKNGYGLWKIIKEKDTEDNDVIQIEKKVTPLPLRDKQIIDFKKKFSKKPDKYLSKEEISKIGEGICDLFKKASKDDVACECITRHYDQYIRDAGDAFTDYKPIRFEKRFIDRKLLELNTELKYMLYNEDLISHLNKHLSYKKDDYAFCSESLNELWTDYLDTKGYPRIHEKLEALLTELFPRYRDHFLHQYQNFLLGTYILDGLFENGFISNVKIDEYSKSWLLASTFHDFAYSIQEYDEWSTTFFKEMLNILEPLGSLQLKTHYVEYSFLSSIEHIIANLNGILDIDNSKRTEILNNLRHFFYHQLTDKKNHAVVSSVTLFKRFEGNNSEEFNTVTLPAGIAIILHDDEIWQTLRGIKIHKASNEESWTADVREDTPLKSLRFEDYPLAHLLLLCDNIQDWGRPFKDEQLNKLSVAANIHLKNIIVDGDGVKIQVYFRVQGKTKKLLNCKKNILDKKLKTLLKSNFPFVIEYWDTEKDQLTDYVFTFQ